MDANPSNQGTPARSPTSTAVPSTNRIDPSYKRLNHRGRFTVSKGEPEDTDEAGLEDECDDAFLSGGSNAPPNRGGGVLREAGCWLGSSAVNRGLGIRDWGLEKKN